MAPEVAANAVLGTFQRELYLGHRSEDSSFQLNVELKPSFLSCTPPFTFILGQKTQKP
jgi:hypothetical protein